MKKKAYLLIYEDEEMWKKIKKFAIDKNTTIKGLIIDAIKKYLEEDK